MFVLDNCIISETARPRGNPLVMSWLAENASQVLALPSAVVFEIQRGIESIRRKDGARADRLACWLESVLASGMVELPMDTEVARLYAKMTAVGCLSPMWVPDPRATKPKLGQDLLIAATAIVHKATLVSVNVKDFARIHRYFPLPGFVCPGSTATLDTVWPRRKRKKPRPGFGCRTAWPRFTVSSPAIATPARGGIPHGPGRPGDGEDEAFARWMQ